MMAEASAEAVEEQLRDVLRRANPEPDVSWALGGIGEIVDDLGLPRCRPAPLDTLDNALLDYQLRRNPDARLGHGDAMTADSYAELVFHAACASILNSDGDEHELREHVLEAALRMFGLDFDEHQGAAAWRVFSDVIDYARQWCRWADGQVDGLGVEQWLEAGEGAAVDIPPHPLDTLCSLVSRPSPSIRRTAPRTRASRGCSPRRRGSRRASSGGGDPGGDGGDDDPPDRPLSPSAGIGVWR